MSLIAPESFTEDERTLLSRYFTNLDGPVFALINLPEVVKGALFARYSRSSKSLRRLFLDEFVEDLDVSGDTSLDATVGLRRAEQLYERVFSEYGDDSVAQLGGVHLACEQSSNLLTKVLERGRLMSYLEQSTRYIPYDTRLSTGHYRYIREPSILESPLGARYVGEMDRMFDTYGELLPALQAFVSHRTPGGLGGLGDGPPPGGASHLPRRPPGPPPGRVALERRDLRLGAELRAAAAADAGERPARGPAVRRDDDHRAAQGDPVLPHPPRAARAGGSVGGVPALDRGRDRAGSCAISGR